MRFARTHAPFTAADLAARYAIGEPAAEAVLTRLASAGRLVEGEFRPTGSGREWVDASVLRLLRRRSLAKLRHEIEPVDHAVLGRFATVWQGVSKRRQGADALLDAIEQLQGAPIAASILETDILPARIDGYDSSMLDAITAAGEVVWVGVEPLGEHDGRVALYLADHLATLLPPEAANAPGGLAASPTPKTGQKRARRSESPETHPGPEPGTRQRAVLDALSSRGASFFGPLHDASGGGYPGETVDALWDLVWMGLVTNDTFQALRAFTQARAARRKQKHRQGADRFRSRRSAPPAAEGRWTLVRAGHGTANLTTTRWATALAGQLLARHGVVTREGTACESLPGGFGAVYPVLKAMEEAGRVRRGYFVAGLGATQFALPGALDLLRSLRNLNLPISDDNGRVNGDRAAEVTVLAATDPANPYGATLKWPAAAPLHQQLAVSDSPPIPMAPTQPADSGRGPIRVVGASVVLVDGALAAYLARGDRQLLTFLPEDEPQRSHVARAIANALIVRARTGADAPRGMLIEEIDGRPSSMSALAGYLAEAGFVSGALGCHATFATKPPRR
jgi:ATP-dependent Lhr-like helicase